MLTSHAIIEFDINHTLQLLKYLGRFFKRKNKNNLSLELKRCIKYIMEKDFMTNINVIISFDATTITLFGNKEILDEFVVINPVSVMNNINNKVFAPLIYYMFPDIQCCGRMIVHKKDNNIIKYLIHRSNFNEHPSEHPGGHIEYIEFGLAAKGNNKIIYSGKQYVESFLQKINVTTSKTRMIESKQLKNQLVNIKKSTLLNSNIIRWILYGTCREVNEEAGLDISSLISNIDLIKIGTKTHYFSVMIDNNITESGPHDKFKSEVYIATYDTAINQSNKTIKQNKVNNNLTLDEFWLLRKNNVTHHAWITDDEMKMYWNQQYRSHIEDVISIISPI